ncbi:hypothetical protein ACIHCQ_05605 [Streptomyces sp. NPDC052236]|uniref:hypothetical protein n=1 Tax=Streptomyces sp. NPDC052236 TaxID=3365686 RepID=UPI0037D35487
MKDVLAKINSSAALMDAEMSNDKAIVFPESAPVLATPAAFLGGVAISSALVGAFEAGRG